MPKRKETLELEDKLHYMCRKRRIYGCEEVTIGFYNNGHGNEIVDFCSMDSKGLLRCYEIKVTMADLKSRAKKSWYGHYNYLFVTPELFSKIQQNIHEYIPDYVGVAVPCPNSWSDGIEIRWNAKKQDLTPEQETMLKESMIRSMSYKMQKYRDAADMEKYSKLNSELRAVEKKHQQSEKEAAELRFLVGRMERILRLYYGVNDIDITEVVNNINLQNLILPEQITLSITERGRAFNDRATNREIEY